MAPVTCYSWFFFRCLEIFLVSCGHYGISLIYSQPTNKNKHIAQALIDKVDLLFK